MKRPAVFFDRDNTLIASSGYLGDPKRVQLLAGAADAVAAVRTLGYATVVFSNQSGVARGYFTEEDVNAVNRKIEKVLRQSNRRAVIDRHEFCPDHPSAVVLRYRRDGIRRKPNPGMITDAAEALALDLSASWVIGDAPRDVAAGKAAGCRTIWLRDPTVKPSPAAAGNAEPDFVVASLEEAVNVIRTHPHPSAELTELAEDHVDEPLEDDEPEPEPEPPPPVAEAMPEPEARQAAPLESSEEAGAEVESVPDETPPSDDASNGNHPIAAQMGWEDSVEAEPAAVATIAEPAEERSESASLPEEMDLPRLSLEPADDSTESRSISEMYASASTYRKVYDPFESPAQSEAEIPAEPQYETDEPPAMAPSPEPAIEDLQAPFPEPEPIPAPSAAAKSDTPRFEQENFDASIDRLRKLSEQVMKQDMSRLENLTEQMLVELKQFRSERASAGDFSVSKLLAGIAIVLSIAMAFLAFVNRNDPVQADAVFRWAIFLLILTVALLIMGRDT